MKNQKLWAIALCSVLIVSIFLGCIGSNKKEKDTDGLKIDDLDFEWVDISPGTFMMGRYNNEGTPHERPRHPVNISKGFQMLKFEVTQAQWEAVNGSNPSWFKGANNPVDRVDWNECQSFISQLNELDSGHTYRLPSEAEWEYTCRAGSTTTYYFGNDSAQLDQYAWYGNNSNYKTHPVGEKKPNAWGLYDMHGNVWEWCQDWWHFNYSNAPDDGTAWEDPEGSYRVIRSSDYSNGASNCCSATRYRSLPITGLDSMGFRLVREPK